MIKEYLGEVKYPNKVLSVIPMRQESKGGVDLDRTLTKITNTN